MPGLLAPEGDWSCWTDDGAFSSVFLMPTFESELVLGLSVADWSALEAGSLLRAYAAPSAPVASAAVRLTSSFRSFMRISPFRVDTSGVPQAPFRGASPGSRNRPQPRSKKDGASA